MNCFNHTDQPAIGICKSCGKGLCRACITEVPNGIACKNHCEARVVMINQMVDARKKVMITILPMADAFAIGMGLLFVAWGIFAYAQSGTGNALYDSSVGVLLLCLGLYGRIRRKRIPELNK
jgi:hypothetical protein